MGLNVRDQRLTFPEVAARETGQESLKPSEVSRFWARKTWESLSTEPGRWFRIMGNKLRYVFNDYEVPNNRNFEFSRRFSLLLRLPLPGFGLIAALGLLGMILLARTWRGHGLLVGFFLAHLLALLVFFVTGRHRLPLVPVLLVYAGGFVAWLWCAWSQRRPWITLTAGAATVVGLLLLHAPVPRSTYVANYVNLAVGYREQGRPDLALHSLDRAIAEVPDFTYAHVLKGELLARLGRRAEAEIVLRTAERLARRDGDPILLDRIRRAQGGGTDAAPEGW
jgi:tetratricopeptide (TPR) repeat protein